MTIPRWWEITIGILLILLGIFVMLMFTKKNKEDVIVYKNQQLEQYKKENPKFKGTYEEAKLILPWSQRMKLTLAPIIGLSLIIVGVAISFGLTFSFFIR